MSYQTATVKDIILEKIGKNTFLPAIQREFVWNPYQIEKLFDSLLCDYPISSFLFWRIREEKKLEWVSYDFIREFDQEKPHNCTANLDGVNQDIFLVLDGQQRITSLNIGLKGSYRFFYRKWRKTVLYLNLMYIKPNDNPEELTYQFLFKEDDSYNQRIGGSQFWYRVGDILNYDDAEDAKDALKDELAEYSDDEKGIALRTIGRLHSKINVSKIVNYYEEKSDDYDKVLEIFIRTNTGGAKLEYSDILLSTATAKWKTLNAREEIHAFTDEINLKGAGFNFGKDFVMKGAMYLTENLPIQYKISTFTQENLEKIENNWDATKTAITRAVELVSSFGFSDKNLVAKLAILPIAQYLRNKNSNLYNTSSNIYDIEDQNSIQKWLIIALLKNIFGSATDTNLSNMRDLLQKEDYKSFPSITLLNKLAVEPTFNETEIERLLLTNYSSKYSFLILSLLYPNRDWKNYKFNEDHIFPKTLFTNAKLRKAGYSDAKIEFYMQWYNTICNIELLDESENKSKNSTLFDNWIVSRDDNFKQRNHIPELDSYSLDNFEVFIERRKEKIREILLNFSF